MKNVKQSKTKRGEEITNEYFAFLDLHIEEVATGKVSDFLELNQIAQLLHVSHTHLSDTIQQTTGHHPCHFYDLKIVEKAQKLLFQTDLSIASIAKKLTYDPSNFSKFFKSWTGNTPGNFRKKNRSKLPKSSPCFLFFLNRNL